MRRSLVIAAVLLVALLVGTPALSAVPVQPRSGNPKVLVWVNTNSRDRVYHCQGSRWYGRTRSGRFMPQRLAQTFGYRAAYGVKCG